MFIHYDGSNKVTIQEQRSIEAKTNIRHHIHQAHKNIQVGSSHDVSMQHHLLAHLEGDMVQVLRISKSYRMGEEKSWVEPPPLPTTSASPTTNVGSGWSLYLCASTTTNVGSGWSLYLCASTTTNVESG
jgi:hypothetical protein